MLGKAAVVIWCEVRPEARAEFEDWHSHEHMPERLAIPGFLRGSRWVGASGEASYFMLYELDEPGTLPLDLLGEPMPYSIKDGVAVIERDRFEALMARLRAGQHQ